MAKKKLTDVTQYDAFIDHSWVKGIRSRYERARTVAEVAVETAIDALEVVNDQFYDQHDRTLFTSIDGRVKAEDSFFKKLHKRCVKRMGKTTFTEDLIKEEFASIKDIAGVRVACPYFDEIVKAVNQEIRPRLLALGYGTDLQSESGLDDKDLLESGDEFGYRAYHFFVQVPAVIDIFGQVEPMMCELQARSELQNVWAVKSHDLLYKPTDGGWREIDPDIVDDMKAVSDNLRSADQFLSSIRRRLQKAQ